MGKESIRTFSLRPRFFCSLSFHTLTSGLLWLSFVNVDHNYVESIEKFLHAFAGC